KYAINSLRVTPDSAPTSLHKAVGDFCITPPTIKAPTKLMVGLDSYISAKSPASTFGHLRRSSYLFVASEIIATYLGLIEKSTALLLIIYPSHFCKPLKIGHYLYFSD